MEVAYFAVTACGLRAGLGSHEENRCECTGEEQRSREQHRDVDARCEGVLGGLGDLRDYPPVRAAAARRASSVCHDMDDDRLDVRRNAQCAELLSQVRVELSIDDRAENGDA